VPAVSEIDTAGDHKELWGSRRRLLEFNVDVICRHPTTPQAPDVERMRLMSPPEVVPAAGALVGEVVKAYASPVLTFDQLREKRRAGIRDPLNDCGNACRAELRALGSSSAWPSQDDACIHPGGA
jgi:hypothetical protein